MRYLHIKGTRQAAYVDPIGFMNFFRGRAGLRLPDAKKQLDEFANNGELFIEVSGDLPTWVSALEEAGIQFAVLDAVGNPARDSSAVELSASPSVNTGEIGPGVVLCGGRLFIDKLLDGDHSRGRFRGRGLGRSRPLLIATRLRQPAPDAAWARCFGLDTPWLARLLRFDDDVSTDVSVMVEEEPAGVPVVSVGLAGEVAKVIALGLQLIDIVESLEGVAISPGCGLRPELVYVDPLTLRVAAVAPRAALFHQDGRQAPGIFSSFNDLYFTPEACRGYPGSDGSVFALAATLYRLVTGMHVVRGEGADQVQRIAQGDFNLELLPLGLREALEPSLALNPESRAGLDELRGALVRCSPSAEGE
ncbi:MAG: hypothetical protein IT370_36730 [Deltaproteobacteria bacterium]|nr:hypothetical protein [Deltaproteobacteria bacterium]